MKKLNLPEFSFTITLSENDKQQIYDPYRKKFVLLTPEEWVRQNILQFLIQEKDYPPSLISTEAAIKVNRQIRRYDALVYDRNGHALMLIECKAPEIAVNQDTFDQISLYNISIKANYLLVTNGMKHYCCKLNDAENTFDFLKEIPRFSIL